MINVYILGIGEGKKYLDRCLLKHVKICGFIDNYKSEKFSIFQGLPVVGQNKINKKYDYIIITLMQYEMVRNSLIKDGIEKEKIITFFDFQDASTERNWEVIDSYKWRTELIWKHYTEVVKPSLDNIPYEIYSGSECVKNDCPQIIDAESTVDLIKKEKKSLARFGDNEFELIYGRVRTNYQEVDEKLSQRLKEVLNSREKDLLIAIADNYGSLEKYTDKAAKDIRMYLTETVRKSHMEILDLNRQYYDAYLSRPYMIYRDKKNAETRFNKIKKVWENENVLLVEGEHTRFGVGNDLLREAKSVERILAPDKNAFSVYEKIKNMVYNYGRKKLILSILGPTASILAYDLSKEKYWILDIGQLDVEYEWFRLGVNERCSLKYRKVSEVVSYEGGDMEIEDDNLKQYYGEVIGRVF